MVRGPVCEMEIEEKTYYFCALACRELFTKAPGRYAASERREKKGAA